VATVIRVTAASSWACWRSLIGGPGREVAEVFPDDAGEALLAAYYDAGGLSEFHVSRM
jgi:predicted secreted protein